MKINIETKFNIGDKVWRKNLVTNEASQVEITRVDVYYFFEENGKENYCVMYHVKGDTTMCNISNKVDANNAFATQEEADACPPYDNANYAKV
jgi:hypothetical protein